LRLSRRRRSFAKSGVRGCENSDREQACVPRTPDGRLWCGFAPGSHFSYSNTGYVLLGRLIERVTGEPHQVVVKR